MLQEIKNVRQEPGRGRRRWFESDAFDLVVWLDADSGVEGFQICYDAGRGDRALTWRVDRGFTHSTIDGGDDTPLKNQAPILIRDGEVPWAHLRRVFEERSATLDPALRNLVQEKLHVRAAAEPQR